MEGTHWVAGAHWRLSGLRGRQLRSPSLGHWFACTARASMAQTPLRQWRQFRHARVASSCNSHALLCRPAMLPG